MTAYLKALIPLAVGVVLLLLDKLVVNDDIPDAVWLTLLGTAPVVFAVPNGSKNGK